MSKRIIGGIAVIAMVLLSAGCADDTQTVNLTYVEWDSEVASTNVVQVVIEEYLDYDVEIMSVSEAAMWTAVASGDSDGNVAAWLPTTSGHYLERYQDEVVDLGPNLEGTRVGLVVPDYVEITSIDQLDEYADRFDNEIIGIDPGAGIMSQTETLLEEYDLDSIQLVDSSDASMTAALDTAINNNEWIAVTGWAPHWKFARYDLRFLEDPKNIYGGAEYISTIVREGLQADMPEVYALLNNFYWTPEEMSQVMVWNQEPNADPYATAKRWVSENEDRVQEWLPQE